MSHNSLENETKQRFSFAGCKSQPCVFPKEWSGTWWRAYTYNYDTDSDIVSNGYDANVSVFHSVLYEGSMEKVLQWNLSKTTSKCEPHGYKYTMSCILFHHLS